MKYKLIPYLILLSVITLSSFRIPGAKLISRDVHINFFSHTALEDISADNYKAIATLEPITGEVVFSVPMQSFEFALPLMQKHFNSKDFLNTKKFPKSKFTGVIANLKEIDFSKNGSYNALVNGRLTIKDVSRNVSEKGVITIKYGLVSIVTKMKLTLADYKISFSKGKASTNLAKTIDITVSANFK
ncbi:MAG: YceI family protein [Flavobacteriales bacterium]|nr:YceI family protein [Flavobacteriales bacterium]